MEGRSSAIPDCGDFMKRRFVQPAVTSAYNFFVSLFSTHFGHSKL